jgi:hypothetical protein
MFLQAWWNRVEEIDREKKESKDQHGVIVMKCASTTDLGGSEKKAIVSHINKCLSIAHGAGIYHCDIRRRNVLCFDGVWQLCDWGLCKLPEEKHVKVYTTGAQGKNTGPRVQQLLAESKDEVVMIDWTAGDDKEMLDVFIAKTCELLSFACIA